MDYVKLIKFYYSNAENLMLILLLWIKYRIFWVYYCVFTPKNVEYIEDIPKLAAIQDHMMRIAFIYGVRSLNKPK